MKKGWWLIGVVVGVVGLVAGRAVAQQPAGPMPSPPTPGAKLPEKPQPLQPGQVGVPTTPAPTMQTPGGIPTLPLPGTLPGIAPQATPYGTPAGAPAQRIQQPPSGPGTAVPGVPMPGPAAGVSGLPGGGLGEPAMPGYPGGVTGRAQLPTVGSSSMLPSALFTDPIYGPYVPSVAPIGAVPTFGAIQPAAPTATYEKPFSDYTPPSVYSPYMNLYRWNPRGPIDNYYSLVRPFVLQQTLNQQYRQRMQSLEMNNRLQQTIIQRLQQQNQIRQGTYQPGYFMNHGSFFQGY